MMIRTTIICMPLLTLACAGAPPQPETPEAPEAPAEATGSEDEASPDYIAMVTAAAEKTAELWNNEQASGDDVTLSLRLELMGKYAGIKASGVGASVLSEAKAASPADINVILTEEQAVAISSGDTTALRQARTSAILAW